MASRARVAPADLEMEGGAGAGGDDKKSVAGSKAAPAASPPSGGRAKALAFVDHKYVQAVMTVITIYALFGDDLRLAATPRSADDAFYALGLVALILFTVELVLNSWAKPGFIFGFYFWLDLLATVSMLPDIGWIWDPLTQGGSTDAAGNDAAVRAGRASRLGTRAGRIVRVVRLVRLVRLAKLYKQVGSGDETEQEIVLRDEPSKVGKKLSDLTTRRVIIIVLGLLISLPLLDIEDDINEFQGQKLNLMHRYPQDVNVSTDYFRDTVNNYAATGGRLVFLTVCAKGCQHTWSTETLHDWLKASDVPEGSEFDKSALLPTEDDVLNNFRSVEITLVETSGCFTSQALTEEAEADTACSSAAYFDRVAASQLSAGINIIKTVFIMIVLGGSAIGFTRTAERLVIGPIERMVMTVKQLAENPLAKVFRKRDLDDDGEADAEGYETALLEATLAKIGSLLQIGFGEAGAAVIGSNMGSTGEIDPLIPGRKVFAIFGFADIREFTNTTECLQEDVMVFVNEVGEIIHSAVHQYQGAANKNVGDAFMVVWKLPDLDGDAARAGGPSSRKLVDPSSTGGEEEEKAAEDKAAGDRTEPPASKRLRLGGKPDTARMEEVARLTPGVQIMADNALMAFLKCLVDVEFGNTKGGLLKYQDHAAVKKRYPDGYAVRIGYGLHVGWAIEGAIGSAHKIDASYLSPHVGMSETLQDETKNYKVPLILSNNFYDLLSPVAQARCRLIDRVMFKGSSTPISMYTFDITDYPDELSATADDGSRREKADFLNDPEVAPLQASLPDGFLELYGRMTKIYLDGRWAEAKPLLEQALEMMPGDGPALLLQEFMEGHGWEAPPTWEGYREMD
eukprot:PLAT5105.1.p1 GENE.PLAT5105.1~~PLAT5105.1.p1  ORF type:complete len:852 (+),score=467.46 PLAT5105.1:115-2670(+)